MFCQKCGANIADGVSFCPVCGNAMAASQLPVNDFNSAIVAENNQNPDATVSAPFSNGPYQPPQVPATPFMPVAPQPQPPQKSNTGLKIAIAVVSVIAVAAIILVILFFVGFFSVDKNDDKEKDNDKKSTSVSQVEEDTDSDIDYDETDIIKDKNEKPTLPPYNNNDSTDSEKINRGELIGDTYTVDYLDISFTKPAAWQFATDSELAQLGQMVENNMNVDIEEYLENNLIYYEMMAKTTAGNKSVIIAYESLTATDSVGATAYEYFDGVKLGMDSTGLGYEYGEIKQESLGGENFYSMVSYMEYNGFEVYQKLFVVMKDKVAASIIITATSEAELAEIEAMFS